MSADAYTTAGNQTWYTYNSGSSADSTVYINPESQGSHSHSIPYGSNGNWEWYNDSGDGEVYINGVPVNRRIEELQDTVKLMGKLLLSHGHFSNTDSKKLNKLIKNLTMKDEKVLEEEKQEEEPLDEKLFEI